MRGRAGLSSSACGLGGSGTRQDLLKLVCEAFGHTDTGGAPVGLARDADRHAMKLLEARLPSTPTGRAVPPPARRKAAFCTASRPGATAIVPTPTTTPRSTFNQTVGDLSGPAG